MTSFIDKWLRTHISGDITDIPGRFSVKRSFYHQIRCSMKCDTVKYTFNHCLPLRWRIWPISLIPGMSSYIITTSKTIWCNGTHLQLWWWKECQLFARLAYNCVQDRDEHHANYSLHGNKEDSLMRPTKNGLKVILLFRDLDVDMNIRNRMFLLKAHIKGLKRGHNLNTWSSMLNITVLIVKAHKPVVPMLTNPQSSQRSRSIVSALTRFVIILAQNVRFNH